MCATSGTIGPSEALSIKHSYGFSDGVSLLAALEVVLYRSNAYERDQRNAMCSYGKTTINRDGAAASSTTHLHSAIAKGIQVGGEAAVTELASTALVTCKESLAVAGTQSRSASESGDRLAEPAPIHSLSMALPPGGGGAPRSRQPTPRGTPPRRAKPRRKETHAPANTP
jgi:hypothetical protein